MIVIDQVIMQGINLKIHQILRKKPSNVEKKTTGQTRSNHHKENRDYNT